MTNNINRHGIVGKSNISLGRFSYGFENVNVRQWGEGASLKIGQFCSIADNINIFLGGNHRIDWITTFPFGHIFQEELGGQDIIGHPATKGDVTIGNDVWIGSGATILSGINIGDGAVISANATVVKNVQPYQIVAGNPATLIRKRFDDEIIELLLMLRWWDLEILEIKKITLLLSTTPNIDVINNLIKTYRV
jgi:acetyltransferase-like isoleucine patch superfamily enzyme